MKTLSLICLLFFGLTIYGQSYQGNWFVHWGYNRSAYTKSDISFNGDGYNFTLNNAVAHDRQSKFETDVYFNLKRFTIPQYNYRLGYFLKPYVSLSIGMDHMKYVFDDNQVVSVTGSINTGEAGVYNGVYNGEEVQVDKEWVQFEHSDGLNYLSAEMDYHKEIARFFKKGNFSLFIVGGPGIGVYIPKTRVNLFNTAVDNKFHLAGFGPDLHAKTRLYFKDHLYLEFATKFGWAFLPSVLCNYTDARINHNFGWVQAYGTLGYQFDLRRNKTGKGDKLEQSK